MDEDWNAPYDQCYWFGEVWRQTHTPGSEWPWGFQVDEGKLYQDGRLCVPSTLVPRVIRAHHAASGHAGSHKLWPQLKTRFAFPPKSQARKLSQRIPTQCAV